jgi:hypothetical protein
MVGWMVGWLDGNGIVRGVIRQMALCYGLVILMPSICYSIRAGECDGMDACQNTLEMICIKIPSCCCDAEVFYCDVQVIFVSKPPKYYVQNV